jgi:hypothetical protein
MPAVLTVGSTVVCPHQGRFTFSAGHDLLTVDGQAVVRQSELQSAQINGCGNNVQCRTVSSILAGLAQKLTVGGEAVALDTATGLTNSSFPWSVQSAGQAKLEAL